MLCLQAGTPEQWWGRTQNSGHYLKEVESSISNNHFLLRTISPDTITLT